MRAMGGDKYPVRNVFLYRPEMWFAESGDFFPVTGDFDTIGYIEKCTRYHVREVCRRKED